MHAHVLLLTCKTNVFSVRFLVHVRTYATYATSAFQSACVDPRFHGFGEFVPCEALRYNLTQRSCPLVFTDDETKQPI